MLCKLTSGDMGSVEFNLQHTWQDKEALEKAHMFYIFQVRWMDG